MSHLFLILMTLELSPLSLIWSICLNCSKFETIFSFHSLHRHVMPDIQTPHDNVLNALYRLYLQRAWYPYAVPFYSPLKLFPSSHPDWSFNCFCLSTPSRRKYTDNLCQKKKKVPALTLQTTGLYFEFLVFLRNLCHSLVSFWSICRFSASRL